MRVAGGKAKGHRLKVPKIRDVRPTQESIRTNIFNILGDFVEGKKVFDLYAGSGSLGIEALSRGAREVIFIESNKNACRVIKENLGHAKLDKKGKVICHDAKQVLLTLPDRDIDLALLDPPYSIGKMDHVFSALASHLKRGAVLVYEHAKTTEVPSIPGLKVFDRRMYGSTKVTFLTKE
ncbi:16S rRNA (guanine(966)-N(2))-methyltransferase RsmD [Candidatus Saccharibacteria bacterium]|nr:16S rRNA (guanine(966)-N(2))-methyltransferase RsmD [Candidatus Saccharibacteria bacterium]